MGGASQAPVTRVRQPPVRGRISAVMAGDGVMQLDKKLVGRLLDALQVSAGGAHLTRTVAHQRKPRTIHDRGGGKYFGSPA